MKWLLVCCFGYTGYKNARFGKIAAHEAINAVARETLLVAKELAEGQGHELIHALVDSLYVWKEGATRADYERLAQEIGKVGSATTGRNTQPCCATALSRLHCMYPSERSLLFSRIPFPRKNQDGFPCLLLWRSSVLKQTNACEGCAKQIKNSLDAKAGRVTNSLGLHSGGHRRDSDWSHLRYTHSNAGDAAHNFRFQRICQLPRFHGGHGMRHQHQQVLLPLTPTAGVPVAQFDKIDGAILDCS
jgi:hypothetical protein